MTLRALETLRAVDVVASEDTRKTGLLLKRHEIAARQLAYHEHNERRVTERVVELLREGRDVALVTNAGTPGIADPGYRLVRRALDEGLEVTAVPGPAALVSALVLSGLAVHAFTFRGFPPRRSAARRRWLEQDAASPHTLVLYESPHRLRATLADALAVYGDRPAALANDLTKLFERVDRGPLSALLAGLGDDATLKGEWVVVIAGAEEGAPGAEAERRSESSTRRRRPLHRRPVGTRLIAPATRGSTGLSAAVGERARAGGPGAAAPAGDDEGDGDAEDADGAR